MAEHSLPTDASRRVGAAGLLGDADVALNGEGRRLLPVKSIHLRQALDRVGFGWGQARFQLLAGAVWCADGAELMLLGAVTTPLAQEWNLSSYQRGSLVSLVFVGVMLGNLSGGVLSDSRGRRLPVLVCYVGVALFSLVSSVAQNFWQLALLRVLVGWSFGVGQPASNAISAEVAPAHVRLPMFAASQSLFAFGVIYASLLVWFQDPEMRALDWRMLVVLGAVPSLVGAILSYLTLPESPYFLHRHGRDAEAESVLNDLSVRNGSGPINFALKPVGRECLGAVAFHGTGIESSSNSESGDSVAAAKHDAHQHTASFQEVLKTLAHGELLHCTLVCCFLCFTLNFLLYGCLYAFPQVLPQMETAVSPAGNLLLTGCSDVVGFVVAAFVGTYLTRIRAMVASLATVCVSLVLFLISVRHSAGLEMLLQTSILSLRMGTAVGFVIVYIYNVEVFPTRVRGVGASLCLSAGRLGSVTCPLVYEAMTEWTARCLHTDSSHHETLRAVFSGAHEPFFAVMIATCGVGLLLASTLPFETAGKALRE